MCGSVDSCPTTPRTTATASASAARAAALMTPCAARRTPGRRRRHVRHVHLCWFCGVCGDVDLCPRVRRGAAFVRARRHVRHVQLCLFCGVRGDVDLCPRDADGDAANDGVCGDVVSCPEDAADDGDGDRFGSSCRDGDDAVLCAAYAGAAFVRARRHVRHVQLCLFCGVRGDVDLCPRDADGDTANDGVWRRGLVPR